MPPPPIRHLILALGVAMAPLLLELSWWTILWCAVFWGYVLIRDSTRSPMPSRAARIVFFSIGVGLVWLSAGMRFEGGDFIALLAVMAGVKPLEVKGHRDSMVTVFLAYFLVITSLFVFENLSMIVYLFLSVWITTAVLIRVNHPDGFFGPQISLSARMVLLAIPLMMLLFLVFPRLSGGIFGAPWSRQTRSGFSNVMRLGDVAQVVLTNTPAFSVSFETLLPAASQRYWRGIVFQDFDGDTWQPPRRPAPRRETVQGNALVQYKVVLEPHGHRHLFVLDLPVKTAPVGAIMDDHTLMARYPVRQRLIYDAVSSPDRHQGGVEHPGNQWLQLPADRHPRTLALGRRLAQTHAEAEARVRAGLDFFKESGFTYTLRPGPLGREAVDDFLFVSRNGFCEHFASAFTVLMRSAGVPTRMVGGYQGGQWHAWGNILTIRQADAHVWCEVWIRGQGWIRVDPTFQVAPARIDEGIDSFFGNLPWSADYDRDDLLDNWIDRVRQAWEAVNIRWNLWFMGFSVEDQMALLRTLGHRGQWLLLILMPAISILAMFLSIRWLRRRHPVATAEQAQAVYHHFLKKLSRVGLAKLPYQGPWDHARQVVRGHPELNKAVDEIVGRYLALRYGREPSADQLRALRRQVRRFDPRRIVKKDNGR